MDKQKLKSLLNLFGFCLLIGAIVVVLKTGIKEIGHYRWDEWQPMGHKFFIEDVKFVYAVPLLITSVISFIIATCIKEPASNNSKDDNPYTYFEKDQSTSEKTEENKDEKQDKTTEKKLEELKVLFDKNLISEEEYNNKKASILSEM